jgi:hypothetical protein
MRGLSVYGSEMEASSVNWKVSLESTTLSACSYNTLEYNMPRNESVARNNNPEENIVTVNIEK